MLFAEEQPLHILEGLKRAIDNIDAIIALIRSSRTTEIIQQRLMDEFNMSDRQAKAIREMQLQRLAGLEREKIENELKALLELIADLKDILANEERVLEIIRDELTEIKNKYGDKRRTEIIQGTFDIEDEDLIPEEDVIISMTTNGYVKRMPVDTYKAQNRGGKGVKGMATNNDDVVKDIINMSTHDDLLVFTNFGKVYRMKGYNIPEFGRTAKGLPIVNLLNMDKNENVKTMISIHRDEVSEKCFLFFVTKNGIVKRTKITEFENIRTSGKIAISLRDDDELVDVKLTNGESEILLAASNGKAIRFDENDDSYEELETAFNRHLTEIESEYKGFIEREGAFDDKVTFTEFISKNTDNILGYFENDSESQVEEQYTSMVFFLEYLHTDNPELYKVANQLFWGSVIAAFLQSGSGK